jgi:DNA-binding NarL/FixJ family response regulator
MTTISSAACFVRGWSSIPNGKYAVRPKMANLPVMNGLEAAREIKRLSPNTAMIIFTVHASYQLVKEARTHGVSNVISKCDRLGEHLLSALRQACA